MKHAGQPIEVRAALLPDESDFGKLNDIFEFRRSVDPVVIKAENNGI